MSRFCPSAARAKETGAGRAPWDVDTGLLKNFSPIPSNENFSFRFRGEIFNLFNHPQWSDPTRRIAPQRHLRFWQHSLKPWARTAGNVALTAASFSSR